MMKPCIGLNGTQWSIKRVLILTLPFFYLQELPLWVILVSALGGLLLLLILILILWKCNFFKRKKIDGGPQYKAVKTKEQAKDPEEAELETLNWNYG